MAGHCAHCGGTGYRNPSRERGRDELIEQLARMTVYDTEFQAEDACDTLNALIRKARKLTRTK